MKKFLLSVALLGSTGITGMLYAQVENLSGCGTNFRVALDDPDFRADNAKFNTYLQQYAQTADEKAGGVRIMPVVVHVIHDGGNSNVSKADINTMITKMNQAYSKTPPNINTLPVRFDSIADNALIKFRLATRDPQGKCTDGIRRVYSPQKSKNAYDDKRFKGLSYWDRTRYLNIWVVNNITSPGESGGGTILGYCLFPGSAPALSDGATLDHGQITSQAVASHEIGHHLNLIHIWGDQNCGSDEVDDTPIHKGTNFAWPNPCDTLVKEATCYENVVDNRHDSLLRFAIGENYQNYMDYVNNYQCPNMFTKGQIERMNATLSFYPFRAEVVTDSNNVKTGVQDNAPACNAMAPVAEFWASNPTVCAGATVNFKDGSFNGTPTGWEWQFEGGSPSSSTAQNPQVTYATPGVYGVTLKVTNANGESTKSKQNVVFILNTDVESKPWGYVEGFEGYFDQENKWTIVKDQTDPGREWKRSAPGAAYTGSYSAKMDNLHSLRDNRSELISPAYNMDAVVGSGKQMRFKVAYAVRTNQPQTFDDYYNDFTTVLKDKLVLSRSTNCGATWNTVKTFTQDDILSAGLVYNSFNPNDRNLWREVIVPLNGALGTGDNVRFRFEFTTGCSMNNNLFIDDINILATVNASINEVTAETMDLKVYPNPVTDNSVVTFTLPESVNKANVSVYDITGRHVLNVYSGALFSGQQTFNISRDRLNAGGVYFIRLDLDGKLLTEKIIVQ